jgi:hypothetical protein
MLIAVDKELYARAEVGTVEGVRLVEGRNQRSWKFDEDEILKKLVCPIWYLVKSFYNSVFEVMNILHGYNSTKYFV